MANTDIDYSTNSDGVSISIEDQSNIQMPIHASGRSDQLPTNYSEIGSSVFIRSLNIIKRGIKSVVLFTSRLWITYIILIAIQLFIKGISHNFGSETLSPTLLYQISVVQDNLSRHVVDGTPALFGKLLDEPIKTKLIDIDSNITDFCYPVSHTHTFKNANESFALVPRGGCPFERKVRNIKESGFLGAIIYNSLNTPNDKPLRMSGFLSNSKINVISMYLTYDSQKHLKAFINNPIIIAPHDWYFIPNGNSIKSGIFQFLNFTIDLWRFSISFLLICFLCLLLYNIIVKRQLLLLETIQYSSDFLLDEGVSYSAPKLLYIPFPQRILNNEDIKCMTSTDCNCKKTICKRLYNNGCCAICIEDFSAEDIVRDLPCGHIFHCLCVDEWLLEHNRLCPVCKQDVLKS